MCEVDFSKPPFRLQQNPHKAPSKDESLHILLVLLFNPHDKIFFCHYLLLRKHDPIPNTASNQVSLTSLYPFGIVPDTSRVEVKHPAGQYLLGKTENGNECRRKKKPNKQMPPFRKRRETYLNSASGKSLPLWPVFGIGHSLSTLS